MPKLTGVSPTRYEATTAGLITKAIRAFAIDVSQFPQCTVVLWTLQYFTMRRRAMRSVAVVCIVALAALFFVGAAGAAEKGQVPGQMLASMGISGMQPLSDAQGMQVRGKFLANIAVIRGGGFNSVTQTAIGTAGSGINAAAITGRWGIAVTQTIIIGSGPR
jgi:hypothetical protein